MCSRSPISISGYKITIDWRRAMMQYVLAIFLAGLPWIGAHATLISSNPLVLAPNSFQLISSSQASSSQTCLFSALDNSSSAPPTQGARCVSGSSCDFMCSCVGYNASIASLPQLDVQCTPSIFSTSSAQLWWFWLWQNGSSFNVSYTLSREGAGQPIIANTTSSNFSKTGAFAAGGAPRLAFKASYASSGASSNQSVWHADGKGVGCSGSRAHFLFLPSSLCHVLYSLSVSISFSSCHSF